MNGNSSAGRAVRIASVGHAAFAAVQVGLGVLGLIQLDFGPTWGPVPEGAPGRAVLIYLCALVPLISGIGLLGQRTAAVAARLLLAFSLLWLLLVRLPYVFFVSSGVDGWYACFQTAVMTAAAWVLYVWFATDQDRRRVGFAADDRGLRIARALYGLSLIPFGVAHFLYLENTAPLVPDWLPWHVAWAYFTGATFIAAGVAILVRVSGRLAAVLSVWQMGLFALLVWVPRAAAGSLTAFQRGEFVATVALTAAGWVVADSYRDVPWLAVGKR